MVMTPAPYHHWGQSLNLSHIKELDKILNLKEEGQILAPFLKIPRQTTRDRLLFRLEEAETDP